jgi:hypothetical protein
MREDVDRVVASPDAKQIIASGHEKRIFCFVANNNNPSNNLECNDAFSVFAAGFAGAACAASTTLKAPRCLVGSFCFGDANVHDVQHDGIRGRPALPSAALTFGA